MNTAMTHQMMVNSPLGPLVIRETEGYLTHCYWTEQKINTTSPSPLLRKTAQQLSEYFLGKRTQFDLPLAPHGTSFQQAVWKALIDIPYGETRSYQQLAKAVGRAKAFRAAGSANGKNPIGIIIPCHRVIRASGALGGYAGELYRKIHLLNLEKRQIQ